MSFFKQGAAIRALQDNVAALSAEIVTVREQASAATTRYERLGDSVAELAVLVSSHAEVFQHQAERLAQWREEGGRHEERLAQLRDEMAELRNSGEGRHDDVERLRRDMNDRFDRWRDDGEGRDEYMKRLRGDLERIERQAAIDLDEIRRTSRALAEALLASRHKAGQG